MEENNLGKLFILLYMLTGIHAGACLSIAAIDLRYIMSITNADELLMVFSPLLKNMGILMAPQFFILLILCLIFSFKATQEKKPVTTHTPLFLVLGYFAITLLVHSPINNGIFLGLINNEDVFQAIKSWDFWHWIRTALSIVMLPAVVKFYKPLSR